MTMNTTPDPIAGTPPDRLDIDDTSHQFRYALIATGARPRPLDFPGAEYLIDSTGFLYLEQLPERILFVGGGFISFEFAHIAARAGTETVIVDHGPRPLRGFDPGLEVAAELHGVGGDREVPLRPNVDPRHSDIEVKSETPHLRDLGRLRIEPGVEPADRHHGVGRVAPRRPKRSVSVDGEDAKQTALDEAGIDGDQLALKVDHADDIDAQLENGRDPGACDSDNDGYWDVIECSRGTDGACASSYPKSGVRCDIDQDGCVNAVDIQFVINGALGMTTPVPTNVNAVGDTDAIDVQLVILGALGMNS